MDKVITPIYIPNLYVKTSKVCRELINLEKKSFKVICFVLEKIPKKKTCVVASRTIF